MIRRTNRTRERTLRPVHPNAGIEARQAAPIGRQSDARLVRLLEPPVMAHDRNPAQELRAARQVTS